MGRLDLRIEMERNPLGNHEQNKTPQLERSHCQSNDAHATTSIDNHKTYDLHFAAKEGSFEVFRNLVEPVIRDQVRCDDIFSWLSPNGNTFLHLAAKHGHQNIVVYIAENIISTELIRLKNFNGDTALHLAARAGHDSVVNALLLTTQNQSKAEMKILLEATNERGNTALHEALINGWESIAAYLISEDLEVSLYRNMGGESALYLAANAGFAVCVSLIINYCSSSDQERISDQFKIKCPIQAAIINKNTDVLEAIFKNNPSLFLLRDGEGRIPLHHAALSGYVEIVRYLLDGETSFESVLQRDRNGALPIHLASYKGHVDIVKFLIEYFPDPGELLDNDGSNILHIAAQSGRSNVVRYILNDSIFQELINMKCKRGNTPLHLATMSWHPDIVNTLTWDKRVNVKLVNGMGMTALDAAEYYIQRPYPDYRQRLTWAALRAAGTPRSMSRETVGSGQKSKEGSNAETYKDRVNTLLLVSTLVATITFAAGFTMPGGYISSDKDLGVATMLRHKAFHVFVLCDAIAMYSSIVVVVALIWAQLGDLTLINNSLTLVEPLIGIALTMMSMAFTAGVFLVVSKLMWLGIVVLVMGTISIAILLILLVPFCTSTSSSNRVLRYLSYYPFRLLICAATMYPKN